MEINSAVYQQQGATGVSAQATRKSQVNLTDPRIVPSPASDNHDTVTLSQEAQDKVVTSEKTADPERSPSSSSQDLSREDAEELTKLKARDVEVRAHEQAHLSAAGGFATGGVSFTYQKGPDGQTYAVGGEVGIDLSDEQDPNATVRKMQTIKRAALAPAMPSSTDRMVAGQASVKEAQARQTILQEQQDDLLQAERGSLPSQIDDKQEETTNTSISPSTASLKTTIAAYEQMSAM